ncbi:MAG: hypothetical protein LBT30_00465 [Clostridiales bacterium]|nr:hypothetical protein [Clostridiales bacterium]
MQNELIQKFFTAIKTDDAALFGECLKESGGGEANDLLRARFGRFPVLSLLYLFKSRKIIKLYQKPLIAVTEYRELIEYAEIYTAFKAYAGKCLRLYHEEIVTPVEMLAIIGDFTALKELYSAFVPNLKIRNKLTEIFKIVYRKNIVPEKDKISVGALPIPSLQKAAYLAVLFLSVVTIVFSSLFLRGFSFSTGEDNAPFAVSNAAQFLRAIDSEEGNYLLKNDLTLSLSDRPKAFGGTVDGAGHTIFVADAKDGLFDAFSGTVKNLHIVYTDKSIELNVNKALFARENTGTLTNVTFDVEADIYLSSDAEANTLVNAGILIGRNFGILQGIDGSFKGSVSAKNADDGVMYQTAFLTAANGGVVDFGYALEVVQGRISDCNLSVEAEIDGGTAGAAFAPYAVENYFEIENIKITDGSYIHTHNADTAGLVLVNGYGADCEFYGVYLIQLAVIEESQNFADITQESDKTEWSPIVGGLVAENWGVITNSANYGNLKIDMGQAETGRFAAIGGIAAMNNAPIGTCYSNSIIDIKTVDAVIYAGGITGKSDIVAYYDAFYNTNRIISASSIDRCGAEGEIKANSESGKVYIGGVSGRVYAVYFTDGTLFSGSYIKDCFSTMTITAESNAADLRIGSMVGQFYTDARIELTTQRSDIEAVMRSYFQGTNAFFAEQDTSVSGEVSGSFANTNPSITFSTTEAFTVAAVIRYDTIAKLIEESGVYFTL